MKYYNVIADCFDWGEGVASIEIITDELIEKSDLEIGVKLTDLEGKEKLDKRIVENVSEIKNGFLINLKTVFSIECFANTKISQLYSVKFKGKEIKFNEFKNPKLDMFEPMKIDGMNYRLFRPKSNGKAPLVVWLHGMGEIGDDNRSHVVSGKLTNWTEEESQACFGENGAYILAPQSSCGVQKHELVKEIIDRTVKENNIDIDRIYVGGCSMGGLCTNVMLDNYSEIFAAAFPICTANVLEKKAAEKVAKNKVPVYYIHCINDSVCDASWSVYSAKNLIDAGGEAYITLFNEVEFEGILDGDSKDLTHLSWVYAHNNFTCEGTGFDAKHFYDGDITVTHIDRLNEDGEVINYADMDFSDTQAFTYRGKVVEWASFKGVEFEVSGKSVKPSDLGYQNLFKWLASKNRK